MKMSKHFSTRKSGNFYYEVTFPYYHTVNELRGLDFIKLTIFYYIMHYFLQATRLDNEDNNDYSGCRDFFFFFDTCHNRL